MNQIEQNIMNSFRLAKSDIIKLQKSVIELSQAHERIAERLDKMENRAPAAANGHKAARKIFVAPKEGKIFHVPNCPFALNIKPKHKIYFKSKNKALNAGFKPCRCIK